MVPSPESSTAPAPTWPTVHAQTLNRSIFRTVGLIAKRGDPRVVETLGRLIACCKPADWMSCSTI